MCFDFPTTCVELDDDYMLCLGNIVLHNQGSLNCGRWNAC